jgi:hypothetical protein
VAFCGGTGIFPFLDLIDYLTKKASYILMRDYYNDEEGA